MTFPLSLPCPSLRAVERVAEGRERSRTGSWSNGGTRLNRHMKMADGPLASLIRSLDAHNIVPRSGEVMLRHRVTILGVLLDVAV